LWESGHMTTYRWSLARATASAGHGRTHPQHPPGPHEERRPRSFIASEGT
jgi:hypothetical protein